MSGAPVIAIDGPTASGKGTVAQRVAAALGFHYLDSGALYRLVALDARRAGVPTGNASALAARAAALPVRFEAGRVVLAGEDVGDALRTEEISQAASQVAVHPPVRAALLGRQRAFRQAPGLVADGRDMGTVVFPDAQLKIFLTASVEARAQRRCKQLSEKGFSASMPALLRDLEQRDERDRTRAIAPLRPADGAVVLDTSSQTVDETVAEVLGTWRKVAGAP